MTACRGGGDQHVSDPGEPRRDDHGRDEPWWKVIGGHAEIPLTNLRVTVNGPAAVRRSRLGPHHDARCRRRRRGLRTDPAHENLGDAARDGAVGPQRNVRGGERRGPVGAVRRRHRAVGCGRTRTRCSLAACFVATDGAVLRAALATLTHWALVGGERVLCSRWRGVGSRRARTFPAANWPLGSRSGSPGGGRRCTCASRRKAVRSPSRAGTEAPAIRPGRAGSGRARSGTWWRVSRRSRARRSRWRRPASPTVGADRQADVVAGLGMPCPDGSMANAVSRRLPSASISTTETLAFGSGCSGPPTMVR